MSDKSKSQKGEFIAPVAGKVGNPFDPAIQPRPTGQKTVHGPGEVPPMPAPPEDEILNRPKDKKD